MVNRARQIALGGEVLTFIDDVNQPIWNPSTISNELDRKLSVNYSSYLAGINIGSISYAREISRRFGTIHASIKYLDYGTIVGADEQGNETGSFGANDIAFSLGYAYNFPHSNFGTQITSFNGQNEELPFELAFGGSYKLQYVPLKWYVTIDNLQQWMVSVPNPSEQTTDLEGNITQKNISFIGNAFRHFIAGAELFPEKLINIRVGYNFRRAAELKLQNVRTFSGISFGFGIKMNRFKFNYAHSKFHSAANVSTFSLEIDLDNRRY
jgi:hypothetical protein